MPVATNLLAISLIAAVAISLSLTSYEFSTSTTSQISDIATHEARSNTKIQADDLASILTNKVESVSTNLQLLSSASAVHDHDVQNAIPLFSTARKSTGSFASSYFWVDGDGKLLWADSFTNKTLEQQYNGGDRSYRDYYIRPKETLMPYYTTTIESVDGVPRLYIGYPILEAADSGNTSTAPLFKGVVVAALDIDTLGEFVKSQLQTSSASTTGLLDKNGIILYSSNAQQNAGKNVFGTEIQSIIPADVKEPFNKFIRDSLNGNSGIGDLSSKGRTSTIAYRTVAIDGDEFAILYVVTPHELAGNVISLIEQQRTLNIIIIAMTGAIAAAMAGLVLVWNRRLSGLVSSRTNELKFANESLAESNGQLQKSNALLEQANEQLKLQDKMQKEFINVAAHELRTPTQAILGFSELLHSDNPEDIQAARDAIFRNANRLHKLTEDVLDVARIEGESLKLKKEKFDLRETIDVAIQDATRSLHNGSTTSVLFEKPSEPVMIVADKARVMQVISNLLHNSLKFTKNGTVVVKVKTGEEKALVTLTDNGKGIDPDVMPKLFTRFASKSESGTGLGLFISKSIVEAHGGKIWGVNNADGKGATFSFTLPLLEQITA